MSLLRQGKALALTIYLGESAQWRGTSLYVALVDLLRENGCAGVTVTRAIAGYGAGTRLHEQKAWHWFSEAPLIMQVVDQPARLHRLIPTIQNMMQGGLITLHEVDVLAYTHARRQGISPKLPVRQVMETALTTVGVETSVGALVELLLQAPFRVLPVVDEQSHLRGIISTGDLITAGLLPVRRGLLRTARELDPQMAEVVATSLEQAQHRSQTAQDIMNRQVRTIGPDQSIREAAQLLIETQLRNLPVVDTSGQLLGMLTRADLLQAMSSSPLMSPEASSRTQPLSRTSPLPGLPAQSQPVTTLLQTDIATVSEQMPFGDAIDALITSPFKRVIVIDAERHVKGIISDVDVLARIQREGRPHVLAALAELARGRPAHSLTGSWRAAASKARIAADVMNRQVVTVADTASIQEAIELMMRTRRKVLPVVDQDSRLIGVVGRSDVLRVLLEHGEAQA